MSQKIQKLMDEVKTLKVKKQLVTTELNIKRVALLKAQTGFDVGTCVKNTKRGIRGRIHSTKMALGSAEFVMQVRKNDGTLRQRYQPLWDVEGWEIDTEFEGAS